MAMMSPAVPMLPTILDLVLEHAAADGAGDHAHEAVALLLAEVVTRPAAADGAEEAAVLVGHGRGVGVVVGGVGVGGLRGGGGWGTLLLVLVLTALGHGLLVGLVLGEGVLLAAWGAIGVLLGILLLLLLLVVAVVAWLALRVGGFVGAVLVLRLAVLETALLGWAEGVCPAGRTEVLLLRVLVVALLGWVAALVVAAAVVVVGA